MNDSTLPTSPPPSRARRLARLVLAGPLASITAALVMAGGAVWLPKGAAKIDNLVLPIVLFPAIWAALFFYASLDRQLKRAYGIVLALALLNAGLIALQMHGARA